MLIILQPDPRLDSDTCHTTLRFPENLPAFPEDLQPGHRTWLKNRKIYNRGRAGIAGRNTTL